MIAITILIAWLYVDYRLNCARSRARPRTLWLWRHMPDDTWQPLYPVRSWGEIDTVRMKKESPTRAKILCPAIGHAQARFSGEKGSRNTFDRKANSLAQNR